MAPLKFTDQERLLLESVLCDVARFYDENDARTVCAFDRKHDQYLLVREGWDSYQRIHYAWVHVELRDGAFWIQKDGTQDGVASDLIRAGVNPERIVPAFQHPSRREYCAYSVV